MAAGVLLLLRCQMHKWQLLFSPSSWWELSRVVEGLGGWGEGWGLGTSHIPPQPAGAGTSGGIPTSWFPCWHWVQSCAQQSWPVGRQPGQQEEGDRSRGEEALQRRFVGLRSFSCSLGSPGCKIPDSWLVAGLKIRAGWRRHSSRGIAAELHSEQACNTSNCQPIFSSQESHQKA